MLESNQWYHGMRHPILQRLLGVRGAQLKTGGRYPQETCFSHLWRAFPGHARTKNQGYHRMRHLIMQRLLGVRGAQLKTRRSYGQKNPKQVFREQIPQDLELGQSECSAREVSGGRVRWAPSRVRGATLVWKWGSCRASGVRGSIRPGSKLGRKVVGPCDLGAWAVRSQGNKT